MGWGRVCGIFLAFRDILVFFSMGNNVHFYYLKPLQYSLGKDYKKLMLYYTVFTHV